MLLGAIWCSCGRSRPVGVPVPSGGPNRILIGANRGLTGVFGCFLMVLVVFGSFPVILFVFHWFSHVSGRSGGRANKRTGEQTPPEHKPDEVVVPVLCLAG